MRFESEIEVEGSSLFIVHYNLSQNNLVQRGASPFRLGEYFKLRMFLSLKAHIKKLPRCVTMISRIWLIYVGQKLLFKVPSFIYTNFCYLPYY